MAPAAKKAHTGTITSDRPNQMWGIDATATVTIDDGPVSVVAAVDHCTSECVGIHAVKRGATRFEALDPIRQGPNKYFAGFHADATVGHRLRHDHESQFISGDFQNELRFLGIESLPHSFGSRIKKSDLGGKGPGDICGDQSHGTVLSIPIQAPQRVASSAGGILVVGDAERRSETGRPYWEAGLGPRRRGTVQWRWKNGSRGQVLVIAVKDAHTWPSHPVSCQGTRIEICFNG